MRKVGQLKSLIVLNDILNDHLNSLRFAKSMGRKIAYVSVGFPVEILSAFGIVSVCIQTHAAMIGALKRAKPVLEDIEGRWGYAVDLCSEIKVSLGIALSAEKIEGIDIPKPDFVVSANNICNQMIKCSEIVSHHYGVPRFFIDMPFVYENIHLHTVRYIKNQLWNLIKFLEKLTGRHFDHTRLWETCYITEQARFIWKEILQLCKHVPAPMTALDAFLHMMPLSTLRGNEKVTRYYTQLKSEILESVKTGEGAVPNEKFRLGWEHLPIYHKMRYLPEAFSKYGGVFVIAPFLDISARDVTRNYERFRSHVDIKETGEIDFSKLSADEILDLIAQEYCMLYVNRDLSYREKHIAMLVEEYSLDGFVFHLNRSCKSQCLSQYLLQQMLKKKFGINSLIVDGDSMDKRFFSEKQVTTRIEAFMESLTKNKNGKIE